MLPTNYDQKGATPGMIPFKTKLPYANTAGVYNSPDNTYSTRVIAGPTINQAPQAGLMGAINNIGQSIAKSIPFQGANAMFGTNYGGTNPNHLTGDYLDKTAQANKTLGMLENLKSGLNQPAKTTPTASSGGAMSSDQLANQNKNAGLMTQYGPGNYNIDPNGNVLPKTQVASSTTTTGLLPSVSSNTTPAEPIKDKTSFPGIVSSLTEKSSGPSDDYQAQLKRANDYNTALTKSRMNQAEDEADLDSLPMLLRFKTGREATLQDRYLKEQSALSQGYVGSTNLLNAANTQQSTQIGGLGTAANLSQPVSQLGLLTSPITGKPLNPSIVNDAVQIAVNMVRSSGGSLSPTDPSVQAILAPFGTYGQQALASALSSGGAGVGYNPQSLNTQADTNQQLGSQFQTGEANLDTGLRNLDAIQPQAISFLNQSGINPQNTASWNAPINRTISYAVNPAAAVQWSSINNDIRSIASQIIAAKTPGTPTSNDEMVAAQDASLLSPAQLESVFNTWRSLGNIQKNTLQQQKNISYGQGGGYANTPSTPTQNITSAPNNPGGAAQFFQQNPVVAAGFGQVVLPAWSFLKGLPGAVTNLVTHMFD